MTVESMRPLSARLSLWWPLAVACATLTVAMTLSPVTVIACIALVLLVLAGYRGLTGAERDAVRWVLVVAIVLRVLAVAALFAASRPGHLISFPFDGDGWFMKQRALWIRNVWVGLPVTAEQYAFAFMPYGWTSYVNVLASLQYVLSPAPYAVHLFNVICYVGAAVVLSDLVRRCYGSMAAVVALIVILFMPTSFMWSVSALKDPLYLLLLALVPVGLLWLTRGRGTIRRIAGLAMVAAAAAALDTIRPGSVLIVAAALALALAGTFVTRRAYVLLLTLTLAPVAVYTALQRPAVQARVIDSVQHAASVHLGNVRTTGHGYRLLDQRFYSGDSLSPMTWSEAERYIVRAFHAFIVVPRPWQLSSRAELMFLPQQLLWYLLLPLAAVGVVEGLRRDVTVTWLLLGVIGAVSAAIAPNEGNIGTMVRHRDGVMPFVVCLGALGLVSILSRIGLFASMARGDSAGIENRRHPASGIVRRIAASSAVVGAVTRLTAGSVVCRGAAALLRPTIGPGRGPDEITGRRMNELIERIAGGSVLCAAVRRALVPWAAAWRGCLPSAFAVRVQQLSGPARVRLLGWCLAAVTLAVAALAPLGDAARPSWYAWAATAGCAIVLITLADPLERAWQERHAGPQTR